MPCSGPTGPEALYDASRRSASLGASEFTVIIGLIAGRFLAKGSVGSRFIFHWLAQVEWPELLASLNSSMGASEMFEECGMGKSPLWAGNLVSPLDIETRRKCPGLIAEKRFHLR